MAVINITDQAHQYRIGIAGRLCGEDVSYVRACWLWALEAVSWRKCTVDISDLTGYDTAGSTLLREMLAHGVYLAARTSLGLVFLQEISRPAVSGPTLVPQSKISARRKRPALQPLVRAAASGE